jgi:hypothetical protein
MTLSTPTLKSAKAVSIGGESIVIFALLFDLILDLMLDEPSKLRERCPGIVPPDKNSREKGTDIIDFGE